MALLFNLFLAVFAIVAAGAATQVIWSITPMLNAIGPIRIFIVYLGWLFIFIALLTIIDKLAWFKVIIFQQLPWPYFVAGVFCFIPYLNNTGIVIPAFMFSVIAALISIFIVG